MILRTVRTQETGLPRTVGNLTAVREHKGRAPEWCTGENSGIDPPPRAGLQNKYNYYTTTGRYPVSFLASTWYRFSSERKHRTGLTAGDRGPLGVAGGVLMDCQINHVGPFGVTRTGGLNGAEHSLIFGIHQPGDPMSDHHSSDNAGLYKWANDDTSMGTVVSDMRRYGGSSVNRWLNFVGLILFCVPLTTSLAGSPVSTNGGDRIPIASGSYRCELTKSEQGTTERLTLAFRVSDSVVKVFSSSWAISSDSPDLRSGYASTCQVEMEKFQQVRESNYISLQYQAGEHEKEHEGCEVRLWETKSLTRAESSKCSYPCLDFNVAIDKNTNVCRQVQ
jgi:hypothetical protein